MIWPNNSLCCNSYVIQSKVNKMKEHFSDWKSFMGQCKLLSSCFAGVVCLGLGWDPPMLSTSSPSQSSSLGATVLGYFMEVPHTRFHLAEQTWHEMKSSSTPLPPRKILPVQSLAKPGCWIEFLVCTIKRYVQKKWKFHHIHSFRANETKRYSANLNTFLKLVSEFLRAPGNWASLL